MTRNLATVELGYEPMWRRVAPFLPGLASRLSAPTLASAGLFDAHMFQLANGLQVVLIPDRRAPVVTHMLWYQVGSADETPGQSGLAHFFEHLMFKGTTHHPGDAYTRLIARAGGDVNAFTSNETLIVGSFATENDKVPTAVEPVRREWQRLASGEVSEAEVYAAKAFLKGALLLSLDGTSTMAERLLAVQRLGLDAEQLTAWNAKIDAVTVAMVRALARRLMGPEALTCAIAGDSTGL